MWSWPVSAERRPADDAWSKRLGAWAESLTLGPVQIIIAVTVNGLIALSAGSISRFLGGRPGWLKAQRYVMGTALGVMAVRIAADRSRAVVTATP